MKITDNMELDEQSRQLIEKIHRLPEPLRKWFCIAAVDPEPEYQSMMQTVTKESERQWLIEIREIFANARASNDKKAASPQADQSKGLTATNTTVTGCRDHCTMAAAGKQEGENACQ